MSIKQKKSLVSVSRIILVASVFALTLMVNASFGTTKPAAAAADYCEKQFPVKKGSSKAATESQGELRSSCQKGYSSASCKDVKKGAYASKGQMQSACNKGEEQKKADGATAPVKGESCAGAPTSIIRCNEDNSGGLETNGVWVLLIMAINILTAGIGIAAVGGIIYGSILYTSAGDNDGQVKQAKEVIRNVVVGVIAYIAMYALLQFVIPGGVFS